MATMSPAESSPSRLYASLLSLTAYKLINHWSHKSIKLYTWMVWKMVKATSAAIFSWGQGANAAASCTRLIIRLEACIVVSPKFPLWPGRSMACFELSPIDPGAIVKVGMVGSSTWKWGYNDVLLYRQHVPYVRLLSVPGTWVSVVCSVCTVPQCNLKPWSTYYSHLFIFIFGWGFILRRLGSN